MSSRHLTHVGMVALFVCCCSVAATAGITIGAGPWIGTDTAGNSFNEEFQDWTAADCRVMDGAGAYVGGRYNHNDGYDNARDLIAFYSRDEGDNYYFRADFYDLAMEVEDHSLDLYVAIDCAYGGQTWMPDWTDVEVEYPWEICIKLYSSQFQDVIDQNWNSVDGFLGSYWHSELDAVEFGISKQTLYNAGWDGSSVMYFTVMTVKDGSAEGQAGDIVGHSDACDTFYDDDRGYSDGVINGAIASNATTGRAKYASIAHGNQSINQAEALRVHIYDPNTFNKTGFIRTLDTHEIFNVPINLHLSGSLVVASQWAKAGTGDDPLTDGPSFLQRVGEFINPDQNDGKPGALVGGVFAEHIMPYFEGDVNQRSMELFNTLVENVWGLTPSQFPVMHTPERVIRSESTNLSPLTGHTFQDIEESPYVATYLDEVTHLHWWFYPGDAWSGYNGSDDQPHQHKIHLINGVYCFEINDREDQAKFGPHDGGMALDTRYSLVDKASHADGAQLTLVFDDWEALAGKSFDPVAGHSAENNNQWQYQQTIRWAANHPWIEVVTLPEILDRATNSSNSQYDSAWVIDHGYRFDLSVQTYEWLKHAAENSYHYWYYNNDSGFGGNEQNFYSLTPTLLGEQGDYHRRFAGSEPTSDAAANAMDQANGAVFLPSGKTHGDLNSAGTLMHDTWEAIANAPDGRIKALAELAFANMIYETAWHEEDYGSTHHYQGTSYGTPWPVPDPTWDGVNTWALRLQNHVRDLGILAAAAQWEAAAATGTLSADTVVEALDLDFDGQDEYVMKNNRVWVCFERWGGRLVHGFAYDIERGYAIQVLGAPLVNPSEPGEEERTGSSANRCSTFKDMNDSYVDAEFTVALTDDAISFASTDNKIMKSVHLPDGSGTLRASYTNLTWNPLYVRVGASPNVTDLSSYGRDHLIVSSDATSYSVENTEGGHVKVHFGNAALNTVPQDTGFENRNLALVEQIEIIGDESFNFSVEINTGMFDADEDGDVDLVDYSAFAECMNGPGVEPACASPRRELFDADLDGDVDLSDFAVFMAAFGQ